MSRSKRDILDTEKMLERLTELLSAHYLGSYLERPIGFVRSDAEALRRISMTLHTWHELECGTERGHIARGCNGNPYFNPARPDYGPKGEGRLIPIPDREAGALKRLKAIMARYPALTAYVQTDPRGCALYILKPGDVPKGEHADAYYDCGLAVFK